MGNPNTISDHLQIEYIRTSKDVIEKPKYYVKRSYKNMDKEKFKNIIESDKNLEIAIVTDDTNVATNALQTTLLNALNELAPMKVIQQKKNRVPYITDKTYKLQNERDKMFKKARATQDMEDWKEYKNKRNEVVKELRKDEKQYKINSLKSKPKDPTSQWKAVKNILNIKPVKPPTKIMDEGEIITDPIKIAEIMNKAYIQKPIDIVNKIPATKTDPLINYKKLVRGKSQELEFELKTINMEDLRRIVKNLKPTTSAGTDTINMKTIKENMKSLEPALLNIVNTSI